MHRNIPLTTCLALLCLMAGCEDLPKPTTSGEQTFGCRLDGTLWRPLGQLENDRALPPVLGHASRTPQGDELWISAYAGKETFLIYLNVPVLQPGTYLLNRPARYCDLYRNNMAAWLPGPFPGCITGSGFFTDSLHTGRVEITRADRKDNVVSGTFSFRGYNIRTGATVTVTDGRFDLQDVFD